MTDLEQWLERIERAHPSSIAMGLDRVAAVRDRMALIPACPVITVGGTNGKGSVSAMLEAILRSAGYRVGCYVSPHLERYNERVRVDGVPVQDRDLIAAFEAVEAARGDIPLTYFEFGTLAAVWNFRQAGVDVMVLEVGLGGRLDAVNAFDADCAVVVSVDMDHMDYLGDTRELIGFEKAGIFRSGRPAVCGDPDPPATLPEHARAIGANWLAIGHDFGYEADRLQWRYWGPAGDRHGLPHPVLRGSHQLGNAATALAALDSIRDRLPASAGAIRDGLLHAENPGRFQVLPGRPVVILDVAHNPHAARALAANLVRLEPKGRTIAVFAMLKDKDIPAVIAAVRPHIDEWCVAGIEGARGASAADIAAHCPAGGVTAPVSAYPDVAAAYSAACGRAQIDDKIIVFGSFYTVSAVLTARHAAAKRA